MSRCSCHALVHFQSHLAMRKSGGMGIRTPDIQLAKLALYQLSYTPKRFCLAVRVRLRTRPAGADGEDYFVPCASDGAHQAHVKILSGIAALTHPNQNFPADRFHGFHQDLRPAEVMRLIWLLVLCCSHVHLWRSWCRVDPGDDLDCLVLRLG